MYIITGLPGVGKTTTAKLLAEHFPKSVHLGGDTVQHFIVNGLVWPDEKPRKEAKDQLELRDKNLIALANNFYKNGFVPIIDVVIAHKSELEQYNRDLVVKPKVYMLDCGTKEMAARDRKREKHVTARWAHLRPHMKRELHDGCRWIDSSCKDVRKVVSAILEDSLK